MLHCWTQGHNWALHPAAALGTAAYHTALASARTYGCNTKVSCNGSTQRLLLCKLLSLTILPCDNNGRLPRKVGWNKAHGDRDQALPAIYCLMVTRLRVFMTGAQDASRSY